jgi:hypothetical protein
VEQKAAAVRAGDAQRREDVGEPQGVGPEVAVRAYLGAALVLKGQDVEVGVGDGTVAHEVREREGVVHDLPFCRHGRALFRCGKRGVHVAATGGTGTLGVAVTRGTGAGTRGTTAGGPWFRSRNTRRRMAPVRGQGPVGRDR